LKIILSNEFIYGILSGLAVALILYSLRKIKFIIKRMLYKLRIFNVSKSQIIKIYENFEDAEDDITDDMKNAKVIFIFSSIEVNLFSELSNAYSLLLNKDADIRLLLLEAESSYHLKRANEVNMPLTKSSILGFVDKAKALQGRNTNIQVLLHKEFIRQKFYIIDDVIYLGFRLKGIFSDKSQLWKIGKESLLYKSFYDQFNDYWEKYTIQEYEKNKNEGDEK